MPGNHLDELFSRDPCGLTEVDIEAIVTRMREAQAQFELGLSAPVAPRPKKSTKTENLLKDLGL
jgi:hypothetical protein